MRTSLSGPRGKPPWKQSSKPLATSAMPTAKLGSERADKVINRWVDGANRLQDYVLAARVPLVSCPTYLLPAAAKTKSICLHRVWIARSERQTEADFEEED